MSADTSTGEVDDVASLAWAARSAVRTLAAEIEGLRSLADALRTSVLGVQFEEAAQLIVTARGRVIVTGMGKSGLVGRKIAATLTSTGTASFYIHPAEAGHGDLGMITGDDVVLALSWSGETSELRDIVNYCRRFRIPLIAVTSGAISSLAKNADIVLALPRVQEACPHDLAPTTSTTVQAALGDALAVALIDLRDFSPEQFQVYHPKGRLGYRLVRVRDIMSGGDAIPKVGRNATIAEAIIEMSQKRLGVTGVVDQNGYLIGAFTDGDLRRSMAAGSRDEPVSDYMTQTPLAVPEETLASEALALMNERSISQVFALNGNRLTGVMHVHDALRAAIS